jgi:hypothetical protein
VYRADWACNGQSEAWCVDRTVRTFRALERIFDDVRPDVLVPEVGNETIRVAAHQIGLRRGIPVLFLLYTIFPDPLRLYVDTLHAPIATQDEVRELSDEERRRWRLFAARSPPRRSRFVSTGASRSSPPREGLRRHVRRKATVDRDNDYLRSLAPAAHERLRMGARGRPGQFYDELEPSRPFVYFPLHVTDDYKITRIIPHCATRCRSSSRSRMHRRSATTSS